MARRFDEFDAMQAMDTYTRVQEIRMSTQYTAFVMVGGVQLWLCEDEHGMCLRPNDVDTDTGESTVSWAASCYDTLPELQEACDKMGDCMPWQFQHDGRPVEVV